MERYGRAGDERSGSDPSPEWTPPGGETGLDASMWRLGLGSGEELYPVRPEEPDCIYYLRTGFCGYGSRCRFNHPRDRGAVMGTAKVGAREYPERLGQPICQYYMRTGTCKFGASCKYHHPRQGGDSSRPVSLNYLGYPLRPGEKECSYYIKTGRCKFGPTCKFHHPVTPGAHLPAPLAAAQVSPIAAASAVYPAAQSPSVPSSQQYGVVVARPPLMPGSYVQSPYGPLLLSPGVVPYPGWNPYPASGSVVPSPGTEPSIGSSSIYGVTPLSPSATAFGGTYQHGSSSVGPSSGVQMENLFPQRPGQPECQYYMKTGDCKFGSSCRYHHPLAVVVAPKTSVVLSPIGLPLRPGAPTCSHYAQHGICKFGPSCRFDHPMGSLGYSPSVSSLTEMPVPTYPCGFSVGTLVPSFSDLGPQLISTKVSSPSVSTTSESVGQIAASTGESVIDSNVPESGQSTSTTAARASS